MANYGIYKFDLSSNKRPDFRTGGFVMESMIIPLRRYAEFDGRSSRSEYWLFALFQLLVICASAALFFLLGFVTMDEWGGITGIGGLLLAIMGLAYLGLFFIPGIAVAIRRWHDLDQSGWFVLLFIVLNAIPYIGVISSIVNLVWFCMPGTSGPNKYGEDPLA